MRVTGRAEPPPEPRRAGQRRSFEEALERTGAPASSPPGQRPATPALPELREAASAIPPAIWSGKVAEGAAVELSFGRELTVELRQGAAGIELSIRTGPALTRAAQVDLPALLRTLRGHGVTVVRAEVRRGSHGGGRPGDSARRGR